MPQTIDALMQDASQALAEMDYARCEALCVEALRAAREAQDWAMVRRVLLPLQEARRQKRQSAIDGLIQLGTPEKAASLSELIEDQHCGCIVLTQPYSAADADALEHLVRQDKRAVEVLYANNAASETIWHITTVRGPNASAQLAAPDSAWIGQPTDPLATQPPTPAHWFMHASEALGNAALQSIDAAMSSTQRFDQLAEALSAVGDHEILHQRLADAAKDLQEAKQ